MTEYVGGRLRDNVIIIEGSLVDPTCFGHVEHCLDPASMAAKGLSLVERLSGGLVSSNSTPGGRQGRTKAAGSRSSPYVRPTPPAFATRLLHAPLPTHARRSTLSLRFLS